jgi:hypothetical protein
MAMRAIWTGGLANRRAKIEAEGLYWTRFAGFKAKHLPAPEVAIWPATQTGRASPAPPAVARRRVMH